MPHTEFRLSLEATAPAVRGARQRIAAAVASWGTLDDEAAFNLGVVVAELLTNSLLHAGGQISVEVAAEHGLLVVSVLDSSAAAPQACEAGAGDECGRGLALIEALCLFRGVERTTTGKCCWAVLPMTTAPRQENNDIFESTRAADPSLESLRWSVTPSGKRLLSTLFPAT